MKLIKYTTVLLILMLGFSINAQEKLSLSDAIALGLEKNYDLRIIKKSEEISGINNNWGLAGALPTLDFTATARENFNYNDSEDYRTQTIVPDLTLNWVLFNGFSARITKRTYELLEEQSQGNTAILIETTIQNIIMAYNSCLLQKELMTVYQELSALSKDRYKRAEDSKSIGASTTYDMLQAKTSWLEDESNYLQQKVIYENAIRTLNFQMAASDESIWELSTPLEMAMPNYLLEDLNNKLMSNNKTLKNQYLNQSLRAKETALAKSNYSPKLNLNTGLSNTWMDNYYQGSTPNVNQNAADAYIGLTLSFNVFNGGIRKQGVKIAKINEESTLVATEQMEHSLKNQLLQMYSNYNVQKAILDLANEKESTAKLNLDLSAEKLDNGSINSFNYRDVQIVYMNAAISKFQALYSLMQSNTDLLRITGGIIDQYAN